LIFNKGLNVDNKDKSFVAGYKAVKNGLIDRELTAREIATYYREHDESTFYNGMIDALNNDSYRYNLIIHKWQTQLAL